MGIPIESSGMISPRLPSFSLLVGFLLLCMTPAARAQGT
jgi:hypothetical protein